jgi:lysophospholipase L1-like esterase
VCRFFRTVLRALLPCGAVLAAACGSDTPTRPTPPAPDPLTLTCPSPVTIPSPTAQPVAVRFGNATATGGVPPVQVTCSPASDTLFSIGRTTVSCNGSDTRGTTASCTFSVTVTPPPSITFTQYVAFGDSITAGEITVEGEGHIRTLQLFPTLAYPADLRASMAARYTAQPITVINAGVKGETTFQGVSRLPSLLSAGQVLLLVEGANDINLATDAQVQAALSNIRNMVRTARSRNLRVFLGSLPPQNPFTCVSPCRAGGYSNLPTYNQGLQLIASSEGVTFVDVFGAFHNDVATLIGPDGLHPTAAGYQVMATAFFDAIKAALEVAPTLTVAPASTPPTMPFPAMQRPKR